MMAETGRLAAVLGPTNTGKTHYAVERMLGYESGMIGFPLRLLAREIYDKVVALRGPTRVALITGEEKIVPDRPAYWICTVESMPVEKDVAFLAVDEVQLAADDQRGHIFTDRLLRARGRDETLFLGSESMRGVLKALLPSIEFVSRQRLSSLIYVKPRKLHRLPRRTAVVGFSAETVYGLGELVRRGRGGAAVVMGALSPRTRNAQVEMYQSGEVDYLVATDAIGMGLNMDIDHVAFARTTKFDGRQMRDLTAAEIGQIAGRAGRYVRDGSFTTVAGSDDGEIEPTVVAQVEEHSFPPIKRLSWRNAQLDFKTPQRLIATLEAKSDIQILRRAPEAMDLTALKALAGDDSVAARATTPAAVRLLWEVCQLPDFRKWSPGEHINLVKRLFLDLTSDRGVIPHDWFAAQVARLDNVQGDLDTLAARIACIRTWTYVAHRRGWLSEAGHWAHVTRGIEDKLSDALHHRLTQRFVDRRTSVLMREMRQKGELSVSIDDHNDVVVEGHKIGRLEGFTFHPDPSAAGADFKTLQSAAEKTVKAELTRRAKLFTNIGYKTVTLDVSGGFDAPVIRWQGAAIARVEKGGTRLGPQVALVDDALLSGGEAQMVLARLQGWLDDRIREKLEPLVKVDEELALSEPSEANGVKLEGLARGVAFKLLESFGVLTREDVAGDLRQIDQEHRRGLRRFAIRIGATSLYQTATLKPHAVELRLMLWALWEGKQSLPAQPTPGLVTIPIDPQAPRAFYRIAGFRVAGDHAVRIDMLERLADAVRPLGQKSQQFEVSPEIMGLVGCSGDDFAEVMRVLGYGHEKKILTPEEVAAEREAAEAAEAAAQAAARATAPTGAPEAATAAPDTPADQANAAPADGAAQAMPEVTPDVTADAVSDARTHPAPETRAAPTETAEAAEAPEAADAPEAPEANDNSPAAPDGTADVVADTATDAAAQAPGATAEPTAPDTVADAPATDEPASADGATPSAAKPAAPVERYLFKWEPRRRRAERGRGAGDDGPRRSGGAARGDGAAAGAEAPAGGRGRAQGPGRGRDGDRGDRGGRPRGGDKGGPPRKGKGGRPRDGERKGANAPRVFSAGGQKKADTVDADSPFAKLQELKDRMEGKS
ncbi:ATP-dependent RNA helicase SUPV3L1/SUV3 [Rhodothalassium salexigens DSM 2132]|uniref:ATP-dependent RNA helicase SUPV3L1/SUV3 n=1 Tax=Rhodothalassium salexigens DSM 2132 TaxID=1188247 RepID=A0A4R2PCQ2_RHOSA|nr:helicase-related protein [Rhodothalassium salexigens]MBB4212074.1 ATP-dependent RNA helicase SUPV3L1/SUV3 [Rhodothalassium salexigens DSM 2132]TCP32949.1 ATP-dependent RNA helicase SUPV3L1/SUV3 [Rhodothalassium salexigens DSM 2132]